MRICSECFRIIDIMCAFSFYVYKVMFMSNTSFEGDSIDLYIKTGTTNDQLFRQIDSYLLSIDDFSVLAQRKKYKQACKRFVDRNVFENKLVDWSNIGFAS